MSGHEHGVFVQCSYTCPAHPAWTGRADAKASKADDLLRMVADVREKLRRRVTGMSGTALRDTYADGYISGLSVAIQELDTAIPEMHRPPDEEVESTGQEGDVQYGNGTWGPPPNNRILIRSPETEQAVFLTRGDGSTMILLDHRPPVLDDMTTVQRRVIAVRLRAWAEVFEA